MKNNYELFGGSDSGTLKVFTESDRTTISKANEIMSRFGKAMPTGMIFSGHAKADTIEAAKTIAHEIDTLRLYNPATEAEVKALEKFLAGMKVAEIKALPVISYVRADGEKKSEKIVTALSDYLGTSVKKSLIASVLDGYRGQKEQKCSVQARRMFGLVKIAEKKAGLRKD